MEDIKEIKADVKELVRQGAVHNELLRQHEARSLSLQAQQDAIRLELEPIKEHVTFVSMALKGLGAILVGLAIEWGVVHLL